MMAITTDDANTALVQCQLSFANLGIVIPNRLFGEESRAPQTEIPRRSTRNDNG